MTRRRRATQNRSSQAGRPAVPSRRRAAPQPPALTVNARPPSPSTVAASTPGSGGSSSSGARPWPLQCPPSPPCSPASGPPAPLPTSSALGHPPRRIATVDPSASSLDVRQASAVPGHPACRPRNPRSGPSLHHQERRPAASLHPAVALPRIDRREGFAGGTWLPASSVARRPRQIAPGRARDVVFVGAAKLTQAPLSDPRRAPWAHPAPAGPRDRGTERGGGVGVRSASGGRRPVRRTPTPCLSAS